MLAVLCRDGELSLINGVSCVVAEGVDTQSNDGDPEEALGASSNQQTQAFIIMDMYRWPQHCARLWSTC